MNMRVLSVFLLFVLSLLGLCCGTQYMAAHFGYAPQLGPPWLSLGHIQVYSPWAWIGWQHLYNRYAPVEFRNAGLMSTAGALAGLAITLAVAMTRKSTATSGMYGTSRWATTDECRKVGLLGGHGVVLCQTNDAEYSSKLNADATPDIRQLREGEVVRHDGAEHVFCFAPTRSGKGVGLVIPTLLSWTESVLVYDIKKENWARTAGWRKTFSRVWRFEPTAEDSVRFNPLLEIRKGKREVSDTQNIADILVDPNGEKQSRDHWQTTAHTLLCGAILHVLYACPDKTLAGVAAFLSDPAKPRRVVLNEMLTTRHLPSGVHPAAAKAAREMLNKSANEMSGVFSTATACLGLYSDPIIAGNTSTSDFRIADLMNADHPVSLYLVVPPSDLSRTRPLVRLMLNQIGRRLTESMEFGGTPAYKHRLLLLLDEFPSLGRLDFFQTVLAFIAGYGLKAFLIAQSLNQLEEAYGPNNSILDNCHVRVTYAANDERTAKRISELLGQGTEKRRQTSYSGSGLFLTSRTESEQEYARALLTPSEVMQLPPDDAIVLLGGHLPYRGRKIRHFLDLRFKDRADLPPPDDPAAQARELLPVTLHDWEGLVAVAPVPEKPARGVTEPRRDSAAAAPPAIGDEPTEDDDVESQSVDTPAAAAMPATPEETREVPPPPGPIPRGSMPRVV